MSKSIPGVLTLVEPEGDPAPVVLDSPHSGRTYPPDFGYAVPYEAVRSGWDAYIDELFASAPAHGATLLTAEFPRTYIDPNRALADLDAGMLEGPWPEPLEASAKTALGKGLIWRLVGDNVPVYDRKLGVAEVQARIGRYWRPYTEALTDILDRKHRRFGGVWHIDCHSMPSVWPAGNPGGGEPVASDFILGDRDGTTCSREFRELVRESLTGMGYAVAVNDRFKGVEIVRREGRPTENRHSLQIEITRTQYMSERTFEKTDGFPALASDLDRLIDIVCNWSRQQVR